MHTWWSHVFLSPFLPYLPQIQNYCIRSPNHFYLLTITALCFCVKALMEKRKECQPKVNLSWKQDLQRHGYPATGLHYELVQAHALLIDALCPAWPAGVQDGWGWGGVESRGEERRGEGLHQRRLCLWWPTYPAVCALMGINKHGPATNTSNLFISVSGQPPLPALPILDSLRLGGGGLSPHLLYLVQTWVCT